MSCHKGRIRYDRTHRRPPEESDLQEQKVDRARGPGVGNGGGKAVVQGDRGPSGKVETSAAEATAAHDSENVLTATELDTSRWLKLYT